jgi:hypothetical protein
MNIPSIIMVFPFYDLAIKTGLERKNKQLNLSKNREDRITARDSRYSKGVEIAATKKATIIFSALAERLEGSGEPLGSPL